MTTNRLGARDDAALKERDHGRDRFYSVHLSERDAWFGATVAVLFNGLGMLIEIALVRKVLGISATPAVISVFVALILLIVLLIRRRAPSLKLASGVYAVNTACVVTVLLLTNLQFAVFERNWVPFQASKLGCLVSAMVAPGFWIGLLSILAFSLSSLLQFEFFFPPEIKAQMPAEPWPTLAFGLAGVLALIYRFRRVQLEQALARIQAQNFAIRRLAAAFLSIRDLMNTPLQVMELSVDLLRHSTEPPKPTLDRIDRSLQSLRTINSVLVEYEKEIEWQSER